MAIDLDAPAKLLIGGVWRAARREQSFDVIEPATSERMAQVAKADAEDVDAAVRAARQAFDKGADADRIDAAVLRVLEQGHRTRDIHAAGTKLCGTKEMGDLISAEVEKSYT